MKESYDDVMVKRKIARLEEDLKRARKEINRLAVENKSQIRGDLVSGNMKSSLKIVNEFQLEKKRLEEEVSFYKHKNHNLESTMRDKEPERMNTMEGINFMGTKMLIEIDSFDKKFKANYKNVQDTLSNVDINSRLAIEKSLDNTQEELNELKKRVDNSILLNN